MFRFLEGYFERTGADEIGALLGGLATDEDGQPMDPAAWDDWLAAVDQTRGRSDPGEGEPGAADHHGPRR
jgi:hypothetical protein